MSANEPANRTKSGKGKEATQFKPGQSGNPNGRPKNPFGELIRAKTNNGEEIVDKALSVLRTSRKNAEILHAAEWLRDTGWHKPIQGVRAVDDEGNDIPMVLFVPSTGQKGGSK